MAWAMLALIIVATAALAFLIWDGRRQDKERERETREQVARKINEALARRDSVYRVGTHQGSMVRPVHPVPKDLTAWTCSQCGGDVLWCKCPKSEVFNRAR